MADSIPIPFTGEDIDTDDSASKIVMTVVMVVLGFGVLAMAQEAGANLYNKANQTVASVTGFQLSGSESSGPEVV